MEESEEDQRIERSSRDKACWLRTDYLSIPGCHSCKLMPKWEDNQHPRLATIYQKRSLQKSLFSIASSILLESSLHSSVDPKRHTLNSRHGAFVSFDSTTKKIRAWHDGHNNCVLNSKMPVRVVSVTSMCYYRRRDEEGRTMLRAP